MRIILYLFFSVALIPGCKPKQNSVSTPAAAPAPSAPTETGDELQALNNLVISFYSTGSGANLKAAETIENFLKEYSAKYKGAIPYSKVAWGREGEVDFCISLSELPPNDRRTFVDNMRSLVKQFELIHFQENHPCRQIK